MLFSLLKMHDYLIQPTEEGYFYMSEIMTQFHLLSYTEKKKVCCHLLNQPLIAQEGRIVLSYILMASEYRFDFPLWGPDIQAIYQVNEEKDLKFIKNTI